MCKCIYPCLITHRTAACHTSPLLPIPHSFSEPDAENYKIGLLVDPCKGNVKECCMNVYGTPEYYRVSVPDKTYPYRVVPKYVLGDEGEILDNAELVDEFGGILSPTVM